MTIKGTEYTLESLLPGIDSEQFAGGYFAVFFLSPADCHWVFSPQSGELKEIVHVPGRRLLVHPAHQRREFPVFTLNERVIIRLESNWGKCVMVLVAGWGVGNVSYPFYSGPRPRHRRSVTRVLFDEPRRFERGEWMATFELGSTVILITQRQTEVVTHAVRDQKVKYRQPIYTFSPPSRGL